MQVYKGKDWCLAEVLRSLIPNIMTITNTDFFLAQHTLLGLSHSTAIDIYMSIFSSATETF